MNWYTAYRPVWLILNLFLIATIITSWYHMNPKVIKIDLDHINLMTATSSGHAKYEYMGGREPTNKPHNPMYVGITDLENAFLGFCAWVDVHKQNGKLEEPFKSLDCTKKNSVSLHDFASHGMHKDYMNRTIWDVYAFGTTGRADDGQLFADGQTLTLPSHERKDYDGNPLGEKPDVCTTKYLKWVRSLQMALSFIAFFYLLLHGVHMFVASTPNTSPTVKMVNELALIGMSVVVYVFVIIVYVIDTRSPIFYKCAWMTQWFQDDMFMLYGITMIYLILGIVGLVLICVHVGVMYAQKAKADATTGVYATISNLVPDPQTTLFGVA